MKRDITVPECSNQHIDFDSIFREAILRVKEINDVGDGEGASGPGGGIPIILVGNKSDLTDQRKVSKEEATTKASSWGIQYIETSALQDENVKEVNWELLYLRPHRFMTIRGVVYIMIYRVFI